MSIKRRDFLRTGTLAAGAAGLAITGCAQPKEADSNAKKSPIDELKSMVDDVKPITVEERKSRIEKAAKLMTENKIQAIYLDGGTSMEYFTGVKWGNSERMMSAVISSKGDVKYVSPHFEEARVRELLTIGDDVRVWEEHESPYKVVAQIFKDMGIRNGKIGMEERVRFFLYDGVRKEASHLEYVSADPVTVPCRLIK
ncbi:MAG: aminopeptidase P family N-terminal domain-containing protein, partial [Bacteroidetes bacterium]|nr:aminopeptidase P family N-terminal domain-containing protein [Bacteroidota bacterium]